MSEWMKDGKIIKGTDKDLGGTMRLGSYEAKLKKGSLINRIYSATKINERHRHRYEVNINYKGKFEKKGMMFSGLSPDLKLPEIIELKNQEQEDGIGLIGDISNAYIRRSTSSRTRISRCV